MPNWLTNSFTDAPGQTATELAVRLSMAALFGTVIAAIYYFTHLKNPRPRTFHTSLVMIAILIAMVTQVIGENLARAFGLVGALSIVRFRTVVEDTQDIAYVIFSVVVGMALGAGQLAVGAVGLGIGGATAILIQLVPQKNPWTVTPSKLSVKVAAGQSDEAQLKEILQPFVSQIEVTSAMTGKQGSAIEMTYRVRLKEGVSPAAMVEQLNRVEWIMGVELKLD